MKTHIIKIDNIDDINPSMEGYYAILSETKPKVHFEDRHTQSVTNFLWYNFQAHFVPEDYATYFKEKLGLSKQEATRLVDEWNTALSTRAVINTKFTNIINVGTSVFGVLETEDENSCIVMQGNHMSFPHQLDVKGAGYRWCYLSDLKVLSDQFLFETFGLSPVEMRSFRAGW